MSDCSVKANLYSLYRDRIKYRELMLMSLDTDDKQYYIEMLDSIDKSIDILESLESMDDCEVE